MFGASSLAFNLIHNYKPNFNLSNLNIRADRVHRGSVIRHGVEATTASEHDLIRAELKFAEFYLF